MSRYDNANSQTFFPAKTWGALKVATTLVPKPRLPFWVVQEGRKERENWKKASQDACMEERQSGKSCAVGNDDDD